MMHCTSVLPVSLKGETCFVLDYLDSFYISQGYFFVWPDDNL